MPQSCTVCTHPRREEIDRELVNGATLRDVARRYNISKDAVHRHKAGGHIAREIAAARGAQEAARADTILAGVRELLDRARALTDQAEAAGDLRTALQGIREIRGVLELLARVTGELQGSPAVNIAIVNLPEWIELRTKIINALEPHPEAQRAVIAAIGVK